MSVAVDPGSSFHTWENDDTNPIERVKSLQQVVKDAESIAKLAEKRARRAPSLMREIKQVEQEQEKEKLIKSNEKDLRSGKVACVDEIGCLNCGLWATDGENYEDTNSFTPAVSKYTKLKKEIEATQTEAIKTLSFVEELKKSVAKIEVNTKKEFDIRSEMFQLEDRMTQLVTEFLPNYKNEETMNDFRSSTEIEMKESQNEVKDFINKYKVTHPSRTKSLSKLKKSLLMPVSEKHKRPMQSFSEHSKSPIKQKHVCSPERSRSSKTRSRSSGNMISKNSKLGLNAGVKIKQPICTYSGWKSITREMSPEQRSLSPRRHGRAERRIPSKCRGDFSMAKSTHAKLEKMKRELESESFPRATHVTETCTEKNKYNNENKIPALESSSSEFGISLPEKRQLEGGSLSQATNVFILQSVENKHNENETSAPQASSSVDLSFYAGEIIGKEQCAFPDSLSVLTEEQFLRNTGIKITTNITEQEDRAQYLKKNDMSQTVEGPFTTKPDFQSELSKISVPPREEYPAQKPTPQARQEERSRTPGKEPQSLYSGENLGKEKSFSTFERSEIVSKNNFLPEQSRSWYRSGRDDDGSKEMWSGDTMITLSEDEIPESAVRTKREDGAVSGYSSGDDQSCEFVDGQEYFQMPKKEDRRESGQSPLDERRFLKRPYPLRDSRSDRLWSTLACDVRNVHSFSTKEEFLLEQRSGSRYPSHGGGGADDRERRDDTVRTLSDGNNYGSAMSACSLEEEGGRSGDFNENYFQMLKKEVARLERVESDDSPPGGPAPERTAPPENSRPDMLWSSLTASKNRKVRALIGEIPVEDTDRNHQGRRTTGPRDNMMKLIRAKVVKSHPAAEGSPVGRRLPSRHHHRSIPPIKDLSPGRNRSAFPCFLSPPKIQLQRGRSLERMKSTSFSMYKFLPDRFTKLSSAAQELREFESVRR